MSPPRRPGPGRLRSALIALLVSVVAVGALPASGSGPPAAALGTEGEISFVGLSQTPWVTREGTWRLELAVDGAPPGAEVTGTIHRRFEDRDSYNRALFEVVDDDRLAGIPALPIDTAPPVDEGGRRISLAVTLRQDAPSRPGWAFLEAGLRPGVYPVELQVLDAEGEELARTVVFLARVPGEGDGAADDPEMLVAPVLDLAGEPTVDPSGRASLPADTVDAFEAVVDGLAVGDELPATLAPRPETIEAIARDPEHDELLRSLRAAGRRRQVIDSTYVDIPLSAWVDRGMGDEITRQRERGNRVLGTHLGRIDSSTWLATGGLTTAAAGELWQVGVRTAILAPESVVPAEGSTAGPVTVEAGAGRTLTALVPDASLTAAFTRRGDPVLDRAALAAELAFLASRDGPRRGVVLRPPDDWPGHAEDVAALADMLLDPAAPVRPVTVSDLLDALPDASPRSLRPVLPPDLGDHPERLAVARGRLDSLAALTGPGDAEIAGLDQRLLLSGARSLSHDERAAYVDGVVSIIERRLAEITVPQRQTITLTSSDGDIPLTVRSGLDAPVSVLLRFESDSRLDLKRGDHMEVTLDPGTNRIEIPVHTRVPGDAPVDITVLTPDGAVELGEVRYTVRSTAISGIGLVLSIGAAAFLLLWWIRHWRRGRAVDAAPAEPAAPGGT